MSREAPVNRSMRSAASGRGGVMLQESAARLVGRQLACRAGGGVGVCSPSDVDPEAGRQAVRRNAGGAHRTPNAAQRLRAEQALLESRKALAACEHSRGACGALPGWGARLETRALANARLPLDDRTSFRKAACHKTQDIIESVFRASGCMRCGPCCAVSGRRRR